MPRDEPTVATPAPGHDYAAQFNRRVAPSASVMDELGSAIGRVAGR